MNSEEKNMELQILEAAENLFLEQGFTKTTTGQIAKEVGCNQALVHYYYRTKDNLFDKIFEEKVRLVLSNLTTIHSVGISFEEKLVRMIGLHFDFLAQNPRLVSFIFNEASTNITRLTDLVEKLGQYPRPFFTQMEAELKHEIDNGTFRPISSIDLMLTIISLNVTPFLLRPIFQKAMKLSDAAYQQLLEQRKRENIEIILMRLKK